ncbi:TPA: hypothetical protein U0601_001928 [Streptococcus suis]|uniref:Uncharacterized protein n=1 Tax=Streptococcus suis TaxID=1307 RepID=A0A3R8N0X5_STRSU|nr:hypothetical protein [Streptococcus suis]NQH93653.1 hypothetical protein [Streptococcus suis]NQO19532.1 hypothetical protein [Streptococcus suis]NQO23946.1 hypothetical protein [Streptococcus suis]RRN50892.1 hypothetical protein EI220_05975 [Streptococcus suis]
MLTCCNLHTGKGLTDVNPRFSLFLPCILS